MLAMCAQASVCVQVFVILVWRETEAFLEEQGIDLEALDRQNRRAYEAGHEAIACL